MAPPPSSHKNAQRRDSETWVPTLPLRSASQMETHSSWQLTGLQPQQGTYLWARDFQVIVQADVWLVGLAGWLACKALSGNLKPLPCPPPCARLSWSSGWEEAQRSNPEKSPWLPGFSTSAFLPYGRNILVTLKVFSFSQKIPCIPLFILVNTFPCCHIGLTSIFVSSEMNHIIIH